MPVRFLRRPGSRMSDSAGSQKGLVSSGKSIFKSKIICHAYNLLYPPKVMIKNVSEWREDMIRVTAIDTGMRLSQ